MHIAENAPTMCSSCYGQKVAEPHVDFESSWDGPVIEGGVMGDDGKVISRIPVSIDELIICETCLKAGARLLGMSEDAGAEKERLEAENTVYKEQILGLEAYVDQLERTVSNKPNRKKAAA